MRRSSGALVHWRGVSEELHARAQELALVEELRFVGAELRGRKGRVGGGGAWGGLLRSLIAMDDDAAIVGEVAFGLNYEIDRFTHNILFDEKIGGTVHVALGAGFPEAGGRSRSGLQWDLICDLRADGEVHADGGADLEGRTRPARTPGRRGRLTVAVVSDTHLPRGSRRLPGECLRRLEAASLILHAGDFTGRPLLDELRELGRVEGVHGNVDDAELRALLPRRLVVEAGGARIGLVHDAGPRAGREARLVRAFPGCAAVVYGHTHHPQVELHEGVWILNPGSPTERRRAPPRSMLELTIAAGEVSPALVELP